MKKTLIIALMMLAGIAHAANAFSDLPEVTTQINDATCVIFLTGRVTPVMLAEFEKQSQNIEKQNCQEKKVLLNSIGGGTIPAYKIGQLIRQKGYVTYVSLDSQCNSACGLIFIAGIERIIEKSKNKNSHMAFHSWSLSEEICITTKPNSNLVDEKYSNFQIETYNYAIQMLGRDDGIQFGQLIFSIGCKKAVIASAEGLITSRIATKVKQVL